MRLLFIILFFYSLSAMAVETIVLDAGHDPDPAHWGANAYCETEQSARANGKNEAALNMKVVSKIKRTLDQTGAYDVILTRQPGKPGAKLHDRPAIACQNKADMFISIHHDDMPDQYKDMKCGSNGGLDLAKRAARQNQLGYKLKTNGFAIFVNEPDCIKSNSCSKDDKDRYDKSISFANAVAAGMKSIGRTPSNHHLDTGQDRASNRPIGSSDPYNLSGIWHQNLAVLRENCRPAVLIELGVITDPEDEQVVTQPGFDEKVSAVIKGALEQTLESSGKANRGLLQTTTY